LNKSYRDEGKTLYDFLFEFYVKCPQCGKFAYVKSFPNEKGSYLFYEKRVLTCDYCGCTKIYRKFGPVGNDFSLWLDTSCHGNRLWAYNLAHLEYIEKYINATLRQDYDNDIGYKNTSMLIRLPKWLTDGKHRNEILKCIEKVKTTLPLKYKKL
jgi:hypothetical protein